MGNAASGRRSESRAEHQTPLQGLRLTFLRANGVDRGFTLREVGESIGMSISTLCAFELGRIPLGADRQVALAVFYKLDALELRRLWLESRRTWLMKQVREADRQMRLMNKRSA